MAKLLVCQHVAYEILGTLDPLLRSYGFRIRYVNFERDPHARPRLSGYRGLVVLGGPMNVGDVEHYPHLAAEVELIREALDRDIPVLGICLGAQLIAHAMGAPVGRSSVPEIGWHDVSLTEQGRADPLFSHFESSEKIFQWHGDTFEIPDGAVHLARTGAVPNQAFRYGDKVYGLQFHLEVDAPLIERWLTVPRYAEELEAALGADASPQIRQETMANIARLLRISEQTFEAFIGLFGPKRRRSPHPHG